MTPTLRPYQQTAVDELRTAYRRGFRRPLLALPTGGGKTYIFSYIAAGAAARGGRVLILVHRRELLDQASLSLASIGVDHGCIAPGHAWRPRLAVQVASVQTVVRRLDVLAQAGWAPTLIVVDECHHATAGQWARILSHWPTARVLGVTATPIRTDGVGLGDVFDTMILGPQIGELIDSGHLSPPRVYAPPQVADFGGVRKRGGDYDARDLADRTDKPTVTGDAVAHYRRLCAGAPAVAFCVSVAHADHVAAQFRADGWQAAAVDGNLDAGERRRRIADLGAGRLHVLTSCDIISEGTDIPVIGAAILLRRTQSTGLYLQQVGRALRVSPGKTHATILDHVGNVAAHGLPDEPRQWSLDGERRRATDGEQGPPPPVTCLGCYMQIRRPAPPLCPHCGFALAQPGREAKLVEVAGELEEVTAVRRELRREQGRARDYEDLVAIGRERGYRSPTGWARKVIEGRARRVG